MEIYEDIKFIKKFNKLAKFTGENILKSPKNYTKNIWFSSNPKELYETYFYNNLFYILQYMSIFNFPYKDIAKELTYSQNNDNLLIAFEIVYKNTRNLRKRYGFK